MKILFVINDLASGGAQRVFINLLEKIYDKEDVYIDILLIDKSGVYLKNIPDSINIKYLYSSHQNNKLLFPVKWINRKINRFLMKYFTNVIYRLKVKEKYDLEISYIESDAAIFLGNSKKKFDTTKRIGWIHTDLQKNKIGEHYERALEKMDYLVAVSKTAKVSASQVLNFDDNKILTVNNIIDGDKLIKLSEEKIDFVKNGKIILAVGRLAKEKGFERLIKVFKKLEKKYNIWQLLIIGEGPEKNKLEGLISELNLEKKVKLLGFKENPYPYFKLADIVVLSSYAEGLPTVLSEAILLNKPIISTNCSGVNEILLGGSLGIICENNEEDLYLKMDLLIQDDQKQDKYKKLCNKYRYLYDCNYNVNNIINLFENIIMEKENENHYKE